MLSFFYSLFLLFSPSVLAQSPSAASPLSADKAFMLTVKAVQNHQVELHWSIAKGYHLYKDRFSFALDKNITQRSTIAIGKINFPAGVSKTDDILGTYEIYNNSVDIWVPFQGLTQSNNINDVVLLVNYQGCSENNFCYPPIIKKVTVNFNDLTRMGIQTNSFLSTQDKITHLLQQKNYFWVILAFIGLGILLAFTPCVLPMIPILSGIILGQNKKNLTMSRSFILSLSYVLGMSVAYALAGILVALAGSHLSADLQSPLVIIVFSLLFFVLALSLFGVYELRLPHFIQHKVLHLSHKQKSGSIIGATVMGALSVLVVSPCVTAPLVGVLTFIAQSGDVFLGSLALFSLGLGMGVPLIIIGTTEGKLLPKAGHWMNAVKAFFGVLLIMVSVSLLTRILTAPQGLFCWGLFFIVLSVYLGVGFSFAENASSVKKMAKAIGFVFALYGAMLIIGAGMGNGDFFMPLKNTTGNSNIPTRETTTKTGLNFQPVKTLSDVQKELAKAKIQGRGVMLDFYANWCVACHEMDKNIFSDKKVEELLRNQFVLLRADITDNDESDDALKKYYNVIAPPTVLFFNANGKELADQRLVGGDLTPESFIKLIESVEAAQ